ncbi:uncharacterized protein LOC106098558 [Oreochromis niloticus]|uniref:uncharacterized protein LOC106098558 n=1 Tax=Oreochromis niloticus TaxID=8128 RepID=UPI000DF367D5|nr:uncharacterized protein LOC106098558 [Oreochromis niloticus]
MVTNNWEASEWLGLITAGLLWVDFRSAEEDEEHFDMCLRSLEEEIMYNAGHLLTVEEPQKEVEEQPEPRKACLKKKPGRAFCHSLSKLYMQDSGEQIMQTAAESRTTVELSESCGDQCYWEEIKGDGCKYYRNVFTHGYLGEYTKPTSTEQTQACEKCGLYSNGA